MDRHSSSWANTELLDAYKSESCDVPWWNEFVVMKLRRSPIFIQHDDMARTTYHRQPGFEIHITRQGTGVLQVGGQSVLQSPGKVVMFNGDLPHRLRADAHYRRTVICIEPDKFRIGSFPGPNFLFGSPCTQDSPYRSVLLNPSQLRQLDERCEELDNELARKEHGWEQAALTLTLEIALFLQRCETVNMRGASAAQPKNELVQQCVNYIRTHLSGDLTLQAVARRFAVSEAYLTRSFSKAMGASFYQYVLLQRVTEAKRLLREHTDLSVCDIAYTLGFSSSSNLTRIFKSMTGTTPSAYRCGESVKP